MSNDRKHLQGTLLSANNHVDDASLKNVSPAADEASWQERLGRTLAWWHTTRRIPSKNSKTD